MKNQTTLTACALIAVFAATADAEPREKGRRGGPDKAGFVERLDQDGDGRVSAAEFDGPIEHFKRIDADSDGFVSATEAKQGRRGRRPRDGDEAHRGERPERGERAERRGRGGRDRGDDRNAARPTPRRPDSEYSQGEQSLGQVERGRPSRGGFMDRLDEDGDGRVSAAEFDGPAEHFQKMDRNGDGFLVADEAPKGPPPRGRRPGGEANRDQGRRQP